MTDLTAHRNSFMPVKYFLNCYRALSDGRSAIKHLETLIESQDFLFSDWKVVWVGTCAILRTSITLFQKDAKSCIDTLLRAEVANEWALIRNHRGDHPIYSEFLLKERDNIIHNYDWGAYERWLSQDGSVNAPKLSLLSVRPEDARSVLMMRNGHYKGRNSLELLIESAQWVEERIHAAIYRAGYTPEEYRNIATFQKRPSLKESALFSKL